MSRRLGPKPKRKGAKDPRTQEAHHIARITKELEQIAKDVPILKFLENVAGAPKDSKDLYSNIVGPHRNQCEDVGVGPQKEGVLAGWP